MHNLLLSIFIVEMAGRSTNFYAYAQNAPLNVKDPSGKILPLAALILPLLGRAALGAAEHVAIEIAVGYLTDGELPGIKGACMHAIKVFKACCF